MRAALRFAVLTAAGSLSAASFGSTQFWRDVGNFGGPIFWAGGLGSSLLQDGRLGLDHTARTADGFLVSLALSEGLSFAVRERRPYGDDLGSFPSSHATLSFEIAAAQSYYHPRQAIYWYGAAALISYARIPGHQHYWQDVVAGAALGYGAGQLSVSSHRGWILAPLVENGRLGGTAMISGRF